MKDDSGWSVQTAEITAESMTVDQAWHVLKAWLSSATAASSLDSGDLAAAMGIDRKRIARCLSRRRDEVLSEDEVLSIGKITGHPVDALVVAASRIEGAHNHRIHGRAEGARHKLPPSPHEVATDRPLWQEMVVNHCRSHIRNSGAAHLAPAWAVAQANASHIVGPTTLEHFFRSVAGFEWLDESRSWFWFGYAPGTNHVIEMTVEILRLAGRPLPIEVIYAGVMRSHPAPGEEIDSMAVSLPMPLFAALLSRCVGLRLEDEIVYLTVESQAIAWNENVAQAVIGEIEARHGSASERELYETLVRTGKLRPAALFDALQHSPLICRLDNGQYGLRGRPLPNARLANALLTEGPYELPDGREVHVTLGAGPQVDFLQPNLQPGEFLDEPIALKFWPLRRKAEILSGNNS